MNVFWCAQRYLIDEFFPFHSVLLVRLREFDNNKFLPLSMIIGSAAFHGGNISFGHEDHFFFQALLFSNFPIKQQETSPKMFSKGENMCPNFLNYCFGHEWRRQVATSDATGLADCCPAIVDWLLSSSHSHLGINLSTPGNHYSEMFFQMRFFFFSSELKIQVRTM